MIKRIVKLFQIARKLSTSGAVNTINQIYQIPVSLNIFFNIMSIGFKTNQIDKIKPSGQKLCLAFKAWELHL